MEQPVGLEIKASPISGKGIFATKSFAPGDVVLELERPLVATLDKERVEDTCGWCFNWINLSLTAPTAIPAHRKVKWCSGCNKIKYCSKSCQASSWKTTHKYECKKLKRHPHDTLPNTVWAMDQIMEGINRNDSAYKSILSLESHLKEIMQAGGKRWEGAQMMARANLMFNAKPLDPEHMRPLVNLMCILLSNSLTLVTPTFDPLGLMMDPRACTANHSCDPNAIIVMDGPKFQFRALKKIAVDEEVLISYSENDQPFGVRQADLKERWHFVCRCSRCQFGPHGRFDDFLPSGANIKADKIAEFEQVYQDALKDPDFERHKLGPSPRERLLSTIQAQTFAYLESADLGKPEEALELSQRAITICRSTEAWPTHRAPIPALFRMMFLAETRLGRYSAAFLGCLQTYFVIDPVVYPEPFHPVRIVHAWTLATLARAIDQLPPDPENIVQLYAKDHNMRFGIMFVGLLMEIHEQIPKSHGRDSVLGRLVEMSWRELMEPEGDMMQEQAHLGWSREQWHEMYKRSWAEEKPKFKVLASDGKPPRDG